MTVTISGEVGGPRLVLAPKLPAPSVDHSVNGLTIFLISLAWTNGSPLTPLPTGKQKHRDL